MRATIDKSGRVVIPKSLRRDFGRLPADVEVLPEGTGLHLEPVSGTGMEKRGRFLVIPDCGLTIDDDFVRDLRDADQK